MCSIDRTWHNGELKQNCNARIVSTGTSIYPPLIALVLQFIGIALFFAFPARYLYQDHDSVAAIVIGAIFSAMFLFCFVATALTDPGVVPAAKTRLYEMSESRPPRTQNILTSEGKCTLKYCDICNIFRPRRVEHCPTCGNCIMKFDHRKLFFLNAILLLF